jgi:hypothetical protein
MDRGSVSKWKTNILPSDCRHMFYDFCHNLVKRESTLALKHILKIYCLKVVNDEYIFKQAKRLVMEVSVSCPKCCRQCQHDLADSDACVVETVSNGSITRLSKF